MQELEGVIDVVSNNVAYQIIVGTHVNDVYKDLIDQLGMSGDEADQPKTKKNPIKAMLDVISESMNPILEPIICAGLLAAFLSIISLTGLISTDSSTYQILMHYGRLFLFLTYFNGDELCQTIRRQPLSSSGFSSNHFI